MGELAIVEIIQPLFVANGDVLKTFDGVKNSLEDAARLGESFALGGAEILDIAARKFQVHGECFKPFVYGHRSVSPRTKSMLPIEAITSAISVPSTILDVAC